MDPTDTSDTSGLSGTPYGFYNPDEPFSGLPYAPPGHPLSYPVPQTPDMLHMRPLTILSHTSFASPQGGGGYPPTSPTTRQAAAMQLPPSPSPIDNTAAYDHHHHHHLPPHPISPPISGSDASADSTGHTPYQHSAHSYSRESSIGAGSSPPVVRRSHSHRYNPVGGGSGRRSGRRSSNTGDEHDSDVGEQDLLSPQSTGGLSSQALAESLANSRKEATRKQRIEAEQRRRDELREGYARLKNVLPLSNQKSSKVSLLERATSYIANIDQSNKILHARLASLEAEVERLREINERLSMIVTQHTGQQLPPELDINVRHLGPSFVEEQEGVGRPLSPPPDLPPTSPSSHVDQHMQQQQGMYLHPNDSSASASQASGSEY